VETPQGWLVVVSAMFGVAVGLSPIPFYTIGMFAPVLSHAFGWSFAALMATIAIQSATVIVVSPLAGMAVDRFGARPIALGSLVLFGLSYMSLSLTPGSLWAFYAQWTLMSVLGAGTLSGTWTRVVNGWFDRNLGIALGVASTGSGVAGFLLKPYGLWLIQYFGWRVAFAGIGLLPIIIGVPVVACLFRERSQTRTPADAGKPGGETGLTLRGALARPPFWIMAAAFLLISFALTAPTPNLENIMRSLSFGLPSIASITGSFGLAVILGRIAGGWLLDRVWAPACAFGLLLLPAGGCWMLAQPHVSEGQAVASVATLGLAAGFEFDLLAFLSSRYFGQRHYGSIYGCFYAVLALGGGLGPVVFGHVFDLTGTYAHILVVGAICMVAGGALLLLMGPYPAVGEPASQGPADGI
jgi:predicted MFS family arabinose efflux permease